MAGSRPQLNESVKLGQPLSYNVWLRVEEHDIVLLQRWLEVMYRMDASYRSESVRSLSVWICRRRYMGSRAYYFAGDAFELAIRYDYSPSAGQFCVLSAGFVGSISAQAALDCFIDHANQFVVDSEIREINPKAATNSMLAVYPKQMDNPDILYLYQLACRSSRINAIVQSESDETVCLRIERA